MTNEELAQHWKVSLKKVERISTFINAFYLAEIVPTMQGNHKMWQAIISAYDPRNRYILYEQRKNYDSKDQAIIQGTHWAQNFKISPGSAKLMGMPEDAYLALKPIKGFEEAKRRLIEKNNIETARRADVRVHGFSLYRIKISVKSL